ncbi:hypothetical protein ILYODFUR_018180 [Ilyodon furcidens]|uniref:Uncharacterized protein n=1 Tax=Ilyodon furcidens TaxID=33524 RepID=A0ABV0TCV9_9TELE
MRSHGSTSAACLPTHPPASLRLCEWAHSSRTLSAFPNMTNQSPKESRKKQLRYHSQINFVTNFSCAHVCCLH